MDLVTRADAARPLAGDPDRRARGADARGVARRDDDPGHDGRAARELRAYQTLRAPGELTARIYVALRTTASAVSRALA